MKIYIRFKIIFQASKSGLLGRRRPSAGRPSVHQSMWKTDQNLGSDRPSHGQIRTLDQDYNFEVNEWTDFRRLTAHLMDGFGRKSVRGGLIQMPWSNECESWTFWKMSGSKAEVEKRWLGTAVNMFFYGIWWFYHKFPAILETRDFQLRNLLNNYQWRNWKRIWKVNLEGHKVTKSHQRKYFLITLKSKSLFLDL